MPLCGGTGPFCFRQESVRFWESGKSSVEIGSEQSQHSRVWPISQSNIQNRESLPGPAQLVQRLDQRNGRFDGFLPKTTRPSSQVLNCFLCLSQMTHRDEIGARELSVLF